MRRVLILIQSLIFINCDFVIMTRFPPSLAGPHRQQLDGAGRGLLQHHPRRRSDGRAARRVRHREGQVGGREVDQEAEEGRPHCGADLDGG